jgi:hypothetical protein
MMTILTTQTRQYQLNKLRNYRSWFRAGAAAILRIPKSSGIEHLFDGGIWVGGKTALLMLPQAQLRFRYQRGEGFEFTNTAVNYTVGLL